MSGKVQLGICWKVYLQIDASEVEEYSANPPSKVLKSSEATHRISFGVFGFMDRTEGLGIRAYGWAVGCGGW